jgi:hypothetical protein
MNLPRLFSVEQTIAVLRFHPVRKIWKTLSKTAF